MIFTETSIAGAYVIRPERLEDSRGFFARTWARQAFAERGLNANLAECSISFNPRRGTLRGLHYQVPPHEEAKIVRCTMGAIFDVVVDVRPSSATRKRWASVELSQDNRLLLYIPEGVAHGFQTLVDDSEVYYEIAGEHAPESARGVRWNDPAFGIAWPLEPLVISAGDRGRPDFA